MTLVNLSWKNIRRNMNRSLVAVFGMAVAAALLTGMTAMSTGFPVEAFWPQRSFMAGDIVAYSGRFTFLSNDPGQAGATGWVLAPGSELSEMDVTRFHKDMLTGYIRPASGAPAPISEETIARLAKVQGVAGVEPIRMMPALLRYFGKGEERWISTRLRGRDVTSDLAYWHLADSSIDKRGFTREDEGQNVAMISYYSSYDKSSFSRGIEFTVQVPKVTGAAFDFSTVRAVPLKLVSMLAVPTWQEARTIVSPDQGSRIVTIQHYWDTDQVIVPMSTLLRIYWESGGVGLPPAYQLGIRVDSMFDVKTIAARLAAEFPGLSIVTVPEEAVQEQWGAGQPSVPQDLSKAFLALAYAAAGLLVMANMHVLTIQRKREIGVLKALGASTLQVFSVIIFESIGFSLTGGLLGYIVVRGFFSLMMFWTDAGLFRVSLMTLESFGRVILLTTGVALLSGLPPAYQAAFRTTTEVLRDDS